jgi:iron uptake system component EfeO
VPRRLLLTLAVPVALLAAACGSSGSGSNATVKVTLSDEGCAPLAITAKPGKTTFEVTNDGSAAVTEFEILKSGKIVGEVEDVIPGADKSFTVDLESGQYTTKCPGGSGEQGGTIDVS